MAVQTRRKRQGMATRYRTRKARGRRSARHTARLKRSGAHIHIRYRGPRISRTRVRILRDDLDSTRTLVADTVRNFWITPEGDIREMLARTNATIGKAVEMLKRAA